MMLPFAPVNLNAVICPVLGSSLVNVRFVSHVVRLSDTHAIPAASTFTSCNPTTPCIPVDGPCDQSLPLYHANSLGRSPMGKSYSVITTRAASAVGRGSGLRVIGEVPGPRIAAKYLASSSL